MKVLAKTKTPITLVNTLCEALDDARARLITNTHEVSRWESRGLIEIYGYIKNDEITDADFVSFCEKTKEEDKEKAFIRSLENGKVEEEKVEEEKVEEKPLKKEVKNHRRR